MSTPQVANKLESSTCPNMAAGVASERPSHRAFVAVSVLLFAVCAALTIVSCASMSAMHGMQMPGGWTMSMAWMRMPGQTWPEAAVAFTGMWVVMMTAMMLPALAPMLWRYREAIGETRSVRLGRLTMLVALGYFFVWTLLGLAVFPVGIAVAAMEMKQPELSRAVPLATGLVVLIAGAFQFTKWKTHHLTCCRQAAGPRSKKADTGTAWRHGLNFGVHCTLCCANWTAVLLVLGVMDLQAMAALTVGITVERLAPPGESVARAGGFVLVSSGLVLIARATGVM